MKRSKTTPIATNDTSYYFLSDSGQVTYVPTAHTGAPRAFTNSVDDTALPLIPPSDTHEAKRRSSLPPGASPIASTEDADNAVREAGYHHLPPSLLPRHWMIYPLTRSKTSNSISDIFPLSHGQFAHQSPAPSDGHAARPNPDDADDIHNDTFNRIDFSKQPLVFSVLPENPDQERASMETLPIYHSAEPSADSTYHPGVPPSYRSSDASIHWPTSLRRLRKESHTLTVPTEEESAPPPFKKKPKFQHSRPLPREFTDHELHVLRRQTRHYIRVVTRSSLGLTTTLTLSGVAPQLLIAAGINAFCLGRGAHELHHHLKYLRQNELKVRKRDVWVAIAEGVVVKLAFMAITINHDDFIILTHELFGGGGETSTAVLDYMSAHPVPGFDAVNSWFLKPMEGLQAYFGIDTMAERAADISGSTVAGTMFGGGGWLDVSTNDLLKQIFLVGAVQGGMEAFVDFIQDRFGDAAREVKGRWIRSRRERELKAMGRELEGLGVVDGKMVVGPEQTLVADVEQMLRKLEKFAHLQRKTAMEVEGEREELEAEKNVLEDEKRVFDEDESGGAEGKKVKETEKKRKRDAKHEPRDEAEAEAQKERDRARREKGVLGLGLWKGLAK